MPDKSETDFAVPGPNSEMADRIRHAISCAGGDKSVSATSGIKLRSLQNYKSGVSSPPAAVIGDISRATGFRLDWLIFGEAPARIGRDEALHGGLAEAPAQFTYPSPVDHAAPDSFVLIPRYDVAASAGHGAWPAAEQVTDVLAFRADWVRRHLRTQPEKLALISADGDSMEPTIRPGDLLLIDTSVSEIERDALYAVVIDGFLLVKRCQRLFKGGVVIKSDNATYEEIRLEPAETQEIVVAGRVCWIGRTI